MTDLQRKDLPATLDGVETFALQPSGLYTGNQFVRRGVAVQLRYKD